MREEGRAFPYCSVNSYTSSAPSCPTAFPAVAMKPSGRTPFLSITTTHYYRLFPLLTGYSAISTQRMGRKQADVHLLHWQDCRFASNGKEHRVCSIQHLFRRRRQVHCALVMNALQHGNVRQSIQRSAAEIVPAFHE